MPFRLVAITKKWDKILDTIKGESTNSNMNIRLGSALLDKKKVIKTGCNRNDRSQWHGITMPGVHAEMSATHSISPYTRPKKYRRLRGFAPQISNEHITRRSRSCIARLQQCPECISEKCPKGGKELQRILSESKKKIRYCGM